MQATSFGKNKKVFVSFARVVFPQSLELHEMNVEFLRVPDLDPEKVQELVLWGCFSHSMEDFLSLVEKRLDIIILELELVQVSNVQEIVIFLTLLKPLEEQDKYPSSFKLGSMLVHPFLLKNSHPAR